MALSRFTSQFQELFDDATTRGIVPGAQFVVFNKDRVLVNGVSGYSKLPTDDDPTGELMRPDDVHRIASAGKIGVSALVLIALERKLAKNGMGLDDLDDHDKFVEIVPEFKKSSGSLVTKIVTGFEPELNENGQKIPILKDADGSITLRMLLTHTAGMGSGVRSHYFPSLTQLTTLSTPQFNNPFISEIVSSRLCPFTVVR